MSVYKDMIRTRVAQMARDKWGDEAQIFMLYEEVGELLVALSKVVRTGGETVWMENLTEEIADVEIMIEQLKVIFDLNTNVDKQIEKKYLRLVRRLENK